MEKQKIGSIKPNSHINLAIMVTIIAFIISIGVGRYPISAGDIFNIIMGKQVNDMTRNVFYTLRLPRTIMVLLVGIGLSVSGSVYQTVFKNPLATPDIIGVSSGANLGAAIAIVFFAGSTRFIAAFAFIGGLSAVFIAISLTKVSRNKSISTFVLAGIVVGSLAQGFIMFLKYISDPEKELAAIEFWTMGSFASITADKLISVIPYFLIGIIVLFFLRWQVNVLSLSDEEAKSIGVKVDTIRIIIIIAATLVVASIVSVTGSISFIGLIGPHIARIITKRNDFKTTILSALIGASILLVADILARSIASSEVPISILTTFIGAPFLAYLMSRLK